MTACTCNHTLRPPSAAPRQKSSAHYADTRKQLLSRNEVVFLVRASNCCFDLISPDVPGRTLRERRDHFRHACVERATEGRAHGCSTMMRADFRNVLLYLANLSGRTEDAFRIAMRTGETRDGDAVETLEQCDRWIAGILEKVTRHFRGQGANAEERTAAWLAQIVKHKEAKYGKPWRQWNAVKRTQLYWTLKNRYAALTGTGSAANRNKSQRRGRAPITEDQLRDAAPAGLLTQPGIPF